MGSLIIKGALLILWTFIVYQVSLAFSPCAPRIANYEKLLDRAVEIQNEEAELHEMERISREAYIRELRENCQVPVK